MRIFLMMVGMMFFAGCQVSPSSPSASSLTDRWLGVDQQALLKTWGQPTLIRKLSNGHLYYQYNRQKTQPFPSPTTTRGVMVVGPKGQTIGYSISGDPVGQYSVSCIVGFELSPNNTIVSVEQKGVGC